MGVSDRLRALERVLATTQDVEKSVDETWLEILDNWPPVPPARLSGEHEDQTPIAAECRAMADRIRRGELRGNDAILAALPKGAGAYLTVVAMHISCGRLKVKEPPV